jgi:hypothetical protein
LFTILFVYMVLEGSTIYSNSLHMHGGTMYNSYDLRNTFAQCG